MKTTSTRDYGRFVSDKANRVITEKDRLRLKRLRASMKKYGFLPFPILVRRTGQRLSIIDGQHRFAVAQELGLPVLYVETERDDIVISECAAAQSPWNIHDYVASSAARGERHYQDLLAFSQQHKMPLARCAMLLRGYCGDNGAVGAAIKDGRFVVKDRVFAERVARLVNAIAEHFPHAKASPSVAALARFIRIPQFDDERLIKRAAAHPHMLKNQPTLEMFSEMYEALYNHASRQGRLPLAFLAKEAAAKRGDVGGESTKRGAQKKAQAAA